MFQTRPQNDLDALLAKVVDGGLATVVFVAPLVLGGRHAFGRWLFVSVVALTAVAWLVRRAIRPSELPWIRCGAEGLIAAALVIVLLQLAPLPDRLRPILSPSVGRQLALWTDSAPESSRMGAWTQVSLSPGETRVSLAVFCAYAMLLLVVVQRIRCADDIQRLMKWVAMSSAGMAAIGLCQYVGGNGKFLWLFEHASRDTRFVVKGAFENENHLAHYLALGVGPLIAWIASLAIDTSPHHRRSSPHRTLLGGGLVIIIVAGLLTFSRGGVLMIGLAAMMTVGLLVRGRLLGRRAVLAVAASGAIAGLVLTLHGYRPLADQMRTLGVGSVRQWDAALGRRSIWTATLRSFADHPWLGTGAGSHRDVYETYFDQPAHVTYTHAESGYLQVLEEMGIAGSAVLAVAVILSVWWCVRLLRRKLDARTVCWCAGASASIAVSLIHSAVDFVWYLPACMTPAVVLIACLCRAGQLPLRPAGEAGRAAPATRRKVRRRHAVWGAAAVGVGAMALFMITELYPAAAAAPHWTRYQRLALTSRASSARPTADLTASLYEVLDPVPPETLDLLTLNLEATVRTDPRNARAHMRLATILLRRFEHKQRYALNAMPLTQIRDAAIASRFPSRDALLEWLRVAVGENANDLERSLFHARAAARLSPCLAEPYICLAGVAFLEGRGESAVPDFVRQALAVRPFDAAVQVTAGQEAMIRGDASAGLEHYRRAFQQDPESWPAIFELMARGMPAESFLETMRPGTASGRALYRFYHDISQVHQARVVAARLVPRIESMAAQQQGESAARLWNEARELHVDLGDQTAAVRCARHAVKHSPYDYASRRWLATRLLEQQSFAEAIGHLKWCAKRQPDDAQLREMLLVARRGTLSQTDFDKR